MVRGQRKEIQNEQIGIRGLETRVGESAASIEGGQNVQWRYTCLRRGHSVTAGGQLQE